MTFKVERMDVMKRFLKLEARATLVLCIRAIPSIVFWIWVLLWFFN
tara:strand:- start:464 stop:601 length:138 start_codon:yes stop_codon:yes gene_type:complete